MFCLGIQFKLYYLALVGRFVFGLGGEFLTVAQNTYTARWFDGNCFYTFSHTITLHYITLHYTTLHYTTLYHTRPPTRKTLYHRKAIGTGFWLGAKLFSNWQLCKFCSDSLFNWYLCVPYIASYEYWSLLPLVLSPFYRYWCACCHLVWCRNVRIFFWRLCHFGPAWYGSLFSSPSSLIYLYIFAALT